MQPFRGFTCVEVGAIILPSPCSHLLAAQPLSSFLSLSLLRPRTGVESADSLGHGRPRPPCSRPRLPLVPALGAGIVVRPCSSRDRSGAPAGLQQRREPISLGPRPLPLGPSASPPQPRRVPSIVKEQSRESVGLGPRPLPLGHEESPASQRNRAESPSASALGLFPLAHRPSPLPLSHEESPASQRNRAESPSALALGLFPSALDLLLGLSPSATRSPQHRRGIEPRARRPRPSASSLGSRP